MRRAFLDGAGFACWCALLLGSPFVAYRFGVLTWLDVEKWIPVSHAATWRAFLPAALLLLSGAAVAGNRRCPLLSAWAGGIVGMPLGFFLMAWAMAGRGGQFEGLIEIVAVAIGASAVVIGLALGSWRRAHAPNRAV